MFLDNNSEMREFLNTFFSLADEGVRDKCFVAEKDYKDKTDYKLLGDAASRMNLFPFSELNPPPSNMSVNAYSRNKDGGKGGFLNATFTDCAEISILEFLCCVFFDPKASSYPIDKLEKASPDLIEFFSSRKSLFAFDMKCRKDWFKVVQDRKNSEGKHDTRINYVKKYSETGSSAEPNEKYSEEEDPRARNEVEPGFLNLFSIFMSIWNPDDTNLQRYRFLEKRSRENKPKDKETNRVIKEFKEVFARMVSIINSDKKSIGIKYDLEIGNVQGKDLWDIYGSIKLTIGIKDLFSAEIDLKHSPRHAKMTIIRTRTETPGMVMTSNLLSPDNELDCLVGKYVTGCISLPKGNEVFELVQENIYNGFSCGCLNNDNLRVTVVHDLYNCSKDLDQPSDVVHKIISNMMANATLSDEAVCRRYAALFFIDDAFLERFFGFVKKDVERTWYFLDAVKGDIGKSTTYNYLKKNYGSIFMDEFYSRNLVNSIIWNNRKDLFEIIEKSQEEEYSCLSIAKLYGFSKLLQLYEKDLSYSFAKDLLNTISKDEIIRKCICVDMDDSLQELELELKGLEGFLKILKESGDIDKKKQEKLFCYYFYARNYNDYGKFRTVLMEQTCDSLNFPIDFVSDCIVRNPSVYFCEAYSVLLKSILKRSVEESSRMKLGEDAFAIIEHVVEFICDDKKKDKIGSEIVCSAEKLSKLLDEVKEKKLIRPVCFNRDKLMKLTTGYLESFNERQEDFPDYISSVNEVMEESSNE